MTKKFNVTVKWCGDAERRTYNIRVTDREAGSYSQAIYAAKEKAIRKAEKEAGYKLNMARNVVSITEA